MKAAHPAAVQISGKIGNSQEFLLYFFMLQYEKIGSTAENSRGKANEGGGKNE
ncbi:hypothetical protein BSNK01_15120 [Bacillaceae bacterium]